MGPNRWLFSFSLTFLPKSLNQDKLLALLEIDIFYKFQLKCFVLILKRIAMFYVFQNFWSIENDVWLATNSIHIGTEEFLAVAPRHSSRKKTSAAIYRQSFQVIWSMFICSNICTVKLGFNDHGYNEFMAIINKIDWFFGSLITQTFTVITNRYWLSRRVHNNRVRPA